MVHHREIVPTLLLSFEANHLFVLPRSTSATLMRLIAFLAILNNAKRYLGQYVQLFIPTKFTK